jgi:hypothetical protein
MNDSESRRLETIWKHASSPKGEGISTGEPSISEIDHGLLSQRKLKLRKYFRKRLLQIKQKTLAELKQLDALTEFFKAYEAN